MVAESDNSVKAVEGNRKLRDKRGQKNTTRTLKEQGGSKMTSMNLLTVQEAATLLRVKPRWIYKMARDGEMPSVRLGRHVRIDEQALQHWIRERSNGGNGSPPQPSGGLKAGGSEDKRRRA